MGAPPLMQLSQAARALEASTSVEEVKDLRDRTEAVRKYLADAKQGLDLQNQAAELRLRAERKLGKLLASMQLRGGNRRSVESDGRAPLDVFGVTQKQSFRWQKLAAVDDELFERYLAACREQQVEMTGNGLLRAAVKSAALRGAARQSPRPAAFQHPKRRLSPAEEAREARNQFQVLTSIVAPFAAEPELAAGERRATPYLLRKIAARLDALNRYFDGLGPGEP